MRVTGRGKMLKNLLVREAARTTVPTMGSIPARPVMAGPKAMKTAIPVNWKLVATMIPLM